MTDDEIIAWLDAMASGCSNMKKPREDNNFGRAAAALEHWRANHDQAVRRKRVSQRHTERLRAALKRCGRIAANPLAYDDNSAALDAVLDVVTEALEGMERTS